MKPISTPAKNGARNNMPDHKNILVTGGAGFLGSHLCDRLMAEGHSVICVDNFFTGRKQNSNSWIGHPRFELMRHDVDAAAAMSRWTRSTISPVRPRPFTTSTIPSRPPRPACSAPSICWGSPSGCKCRDLPGLDVGSLRRPPVHPQPEDYWGNVNPIGPRACYDEGKRCAETLFFDYHRQHSLDIKVARIFNTYGPRMHPNDGRVVSNFIVQALNGEPITIYGDGSQTRSFCYVDDLIEGFVRLMASPASVTGPVNLGNPEEFTIKELADLVIDMTGSSSELTYLPLPQNDPRQRRPDISLAKEALGWRPSVKLREGLTRTIEYFDGVLSTEGPVAGALENTALGA